MTEHLQPLPPSYGHEDAFFRQLLNSLGKLADTAGDGSADERSNALQQWLAALVLARQHGDGYLDLRAPHLQHLPPLSGLQQYFPGLIQHLDHTSDDGKSPLVVFANFLALRRDYAVFRRIRDYLLQPQSLPAVDLTAVADSSTDLWALAAERRLNHQQQVAAVAAAVLPFCLITGGAGTGKTTTLAKALQLLLLLAPDSSICLAAPTGKAARRLNDSLQQQLPYLDAAVRDSIANLQVLTLHRLLGIGKHGGRPFHNADNPLHCDVLAIDEASMLSSDLFLLLQDAMLAHTRLILLGDAKQLPAINGVAVFNDIAALPICRSEEFCKQANKLLDQPLETNNLGIGGDKTRLSDSLCVLSSPHRFAESSSVHQAANAVLQCQSHALIESLGQHFYAISALPCDWRQHLAASYPDEQNALLAALAQRIVLCAHRRGEFGSDSLNLYLDSYFRNRLQSRQLWYQGRRIMIVQNNYRLELYNGDIGYCDMTTGQPQLLFEHGRCYRLTDLNPSLYTLAFAISIHKSQGSEYQHVDIVTGGNSHTADGQEYLSPLLTPSLLYTAITRAQKSITLYGDKTQLQQALQADPAPPSALAVFLQPH